MEKLLPAQRALQRQAGLQGASAISPGLGTFVWLLISVDTSLYPGSGNTTELCNATKASAVPEVSQGHHSHVTSAALTQAEAPGAAAGLDMSN